MQGDAILYSEMTPQPSWEDEFNDWYDHEHIPLRMAVPGFRSAQRYRVEGKPNYLVVYEMDSLAVLKSPAYLAVKNNPSERTRRMLTGVSGFTRYIAERIGEPTGAADPAEALDAPWLYSVFFKVPPEHEEKVPALMVRRFRIVDGEPKSWTHLALHYLADAPRLSEEKRLNADCLVHHKYGSRR